MERIVPQWFTIEYWQGNATVTAATRGRGKSWFIDTRTESLVLRHYQRGGWMAVLLNDRYWWSGLSQTRAWREWHLLVLMRKLGLPVPQPLGVHVRHAGVFYRADLITFRIQHAQSLSDRLTRQAIDDAVWFRIGEVLQRFHTHRIFHADLNAHNILLDTNQDVYVIDFDKGRQLQDEEVQGWQTANLQRLLHSLTKLKSQNPAFAFGDNNWQALLQGYETT